MFLFDKSLEILNFFNTLKRKHFSKKLEYRFLVESTKIKSTPFLYKNNLLEPNINPIKDEGPKKAPPTSFSPITFISTGTNPRNFLTFSFDSFATLA